jgi:hypothetical protein
MLDHNSFSAIWKRLNQGAPEQEIRGAAAENLKRGARIWCLRQLVNEAEA